MAKRFDVLVADRIDVRKRGDALQPQRDQHEARGGAASSSAKRNDDQDAAGVFQNTCAPDLAAARRRIGGRRPLARPLLDACGLQLAAGGMISRPRGVRTGLA